MRKRIVPALFTALLFIGCSREKDVTGSSTSTNHASYTVSCCQDNASTNPTYPSFLPPAHVQLCQEAKAACQTNDCQINGATYVPMHVDCGHGNHNIGDEYYPVNGY